MEDYTHEREVVIAKVIAGSCLFGISVLCGIIPMKLAQIFKWSESIDPNSKSDKKSSKIVSILLCFGGGVLLATTFLHLLPEVSHEVERLVEEEKVVELEGLFGAELLMMIGFFLIYLIEEIVHYYLHRYQNAKMKGEEENLQTIKDEDFAEALMRGISARNSVHRRFSDTHFTSTNSQRGSVVDVSLSVQEKGQTISSNNETSRSNNNHGHSHAFPMPHSKEEDMLVSSLRGLLIVLALSIHELFEGFAVGLEKTAPGVYYLFAAVCAHKFVISFCIGVELMVQRTKIWLAFLYVIVYSIVSAIGIFVGAILTSGSNGEYLEVPNVILQGLATGTLLYVIFFEVLSKDRSGILPYISVFFGFLFMTLLQYFAGLTEGNILSVSDEIDSTWSPNL